MADNNQPSFTFGVEIETLYVYQFADFHRIMRLPIGQHATARQRKEYVAAILRHEIPAMSGLTPSILGGVVIDENQQSDHNQWTVTDDSSIGAGPYEIEKLFHISQADTVKVCDWDQIELISPVFRFQGSTWLPQLQQIYADLVPRARLGASFCNESCGLHVHFAIESPDSPLPWDSSAPPAFPLLVLQNLIILWAYLETSIESFHPFHRRQKCNAYAASLRASSDFWELDSWEAWAGHVYGLQSSDELRHFLAGRGAPKFFKVHISPAREYKRETIEFREHRGTTDPEEIRWWVVFIERMIQHCWSLAQTNFRFFAADLVTKNVEHPEDMWAMIDMPEEGRKFLRAKIIEYAAVDWERMYPMPSTGADAAGSQASMDGIFDDEMNWNAGDEDENEDADSDYFTEYMAADAVPSVELDEGEEVVWGDIIQYGREETS